MTLRVTGFLAGGMAVAEFAVIRSSSISFLQGLKPVLGGYVEVAVETATHKV